MRSVPDPFMPPHEIRMILLRDQEERLDRRIAALRERHAEKKRQAEKAARAAARAAGRSPPAVNRRWTKRDIAAINRRRRDGETLKAIAKTYGVCGQRICQILAYDRFRARRATDGWSAGLSARARNTIRNSVPGDEVWQTPREAAEAFAATNVTADEMHRIPNCGKLTTKEIAVWLRRHRFRLESL
jgi:hypothetical protein